MGSQRPLVERYDEMKGRMAVLQAKAAMYETWIRENHPDCPLLAENIVAQLFCVNHPNLTATHTADMPKSTPPYREDVPLCAECAPRVETIGFSVVVLTGGRRRPT